MDEITAYRSATSILSKHGPLPRGHLWSCAVPTPSTLISTLMESDHAAHSGSSSVNRVRLARLTRISRASGMRYQVSSEHPIRAQSSQCRTRALSASTLIRTLTPLAHAGRLGQGGPLPPCRDALRAVSECRSRAQIGSLGAGFAKSRLSGPSHGSFTRSHTHFDLLAGPVPRHAAVTTHERGSHLDEPQPTSDPGRCAGLIDALVARTKCTTHPTLSSEPDSSRLVTRGRR